MGVPLSELTLVKATPEQEKDASKRSFAQWGRGKSLEEFLARDEFLYQQEHSTDGKWTTWVLVRRDDPKSPDYLCACETFKRPGAIAKPQDTHPTPVISYGIASVFTPSQNRGNGYASHMMRLLHWVLAPSSVLPPSTFPAEWGLPPPDGPRDGQFSVLYSDVGSKFYHACGPIPIIPNSGWETISPVSTSWTVDSPTDTTGIDIGGDWMLLTEEDVYKIWEQDSKAMQADILSSAKSSGKVAFTFLPTGGVGKFSIQRNVKFTQPDLKPVLDKFWGVARRSADGSSSPDAYATWTYEPGTKTIVLTRIRASKDEFPALLAKLKEAARSIGRDTIEVWNLPDHLKDVGKQIGGETVEREEHLSAVKWYGLEETGDLLWCFNEKFCWC